MAHSLGLLVHETRFGVLSRSLGLAELLLQIERYDEAVLAADEATILQPGQYRSRVIKARALLLDDRPEDCASIRLPANPVLTATCLEAMGNEAEARAMITKTVSDIRAGTTLNPEGGYTSVVTFEDLAVYYAQRDDVNGALEWAEAAYYQSPVGIEVRVLQSDLFSPVRDDPVFDERITEIRNAIYTRVRDDSDQYFLE